jgi:hypothetical protein
MLVYTYMCMYVYLYCVRTFECSINVCVYDHICVCLIGLVCICRHVCMCVSVLVWMYALID